MTDVNHPSGTDRLAEVINQGNYSWKRKEYLPTFEDHNVNIYQGLEYKDIMLINPNR